MANFVLVSFFMLSALLLVHRPAWACAECSEDSNQHGRKPHDKHLHEKPEDAKQAREHCQDQEQDQNHAQALKQKTFGAALNAKSLKVALASLLNDPKHHLNQTVQTNGQVAKLCTEKGCWLTLKNGEATIRVTFKNYGFFVPQEILNQYVALEGQIVEKTVNEKTVMQFVADGVEVMDGL